MKNVLVTGGKGQLASAIRNAMHGIDRYQVVYLDWDGLDITKRDEVRAFFEDSDWDYCINCAAYTAVDEAEDEREKAYRINAEGAKNLAAACKINGCILIHISTDFVFDGEKSGAYSESDIPSPINYYGQTKLEAERFIRALLKQYFIIRTSWIYSQYGTNFMKTMLRLGTERSELNVVDDQLGSPTNANDLAEFVAFLITDRRREFGIYNYTNSGKISWYDFAVEIFKQAGIQIKVNPVPSKAYPTKAKRPRNSKLDTTKVTDTFQINIPSWESSLEKCLLKLNRVS